MTGLERLIHSGHFVVTGEIVPPLAADPRPLLRQAALLRGAVDAVNVTDAAAGRTTMSSFAAAAILAANGYEPIVQVTCRDRNRVALLSELLGAAAQGIHNVLVLSGDSFARGDQPGASAVSDLTPVELLGFARDMCERGVLPSGRRIECPPHYFLGAADTPRVGESGSPPPSVLAKLDAGAAFIQTQFCFDLQLIESYLHRLRALGVTQRAALLVGLGPIPSPRSARWMNENLPGVSVPAAIISRLEAAVDPMAEGVRICVELIAALRQMPGIAGVHLMAPAGGAAAIAEVSRAAAGILGR